VALSHSGFVLLPLQAAHGVTANKSIHLPVSRFQLLSMVSCKCLKSKTMCECPLFQAFRREVAEDSVYVRESYSFNAQKCWVA